MRIRFRRAIVGILGAGLWMWWKEGWWIGGGGEVAFLFFLSGTVVLVSGLWIFVGWVWEKQVRGKTISVLFVLLLQLCIVLYWMCKV